MARRTIIAIVLGWALLIAFSPVAGADPAQPSNYRSQVEWIAPATNVITARVVGGDGFIELHVRHGHTVTVAGYTGEPWLRVDAHGIVQENRASSATYLNESRFGDAANTQIPSWVSIKGATDHPIWRTVATNGQYIWHDHRIHWMDPNAPPPLVPGTNRVAIGERNDGRWVLPLTVDGRPTQIVGELLHEPAPSVTPLWGLVVLIVGMMTALGVLRRERSARIGAVLLAGAGGLALWAGIAEFAAVPKLAGGNPVWIALPAVCIAAALSALVVRANATRAILSLAAAGSLGVWAVLRVPAFGKAVPLGNLDPTLTRFIAAGALGTAIGGIAIVALARGLQIQLNGLDDGNDPDGSPSGTN